MKIDGHEVMRPGWLPYDRDTWTALRARVFTEQDGRCATCWREAEELHHRHYDNFGREDRADVVGLCCPCHDAITNRIRAERYTYQPIKHLPAAVPTPPVRHRPTEQFCEVVTTTMKSNKRTKFSKEHDYELL